VRTNEEQRMATSGKRIGIAIVGAIVILVVAVLLGIYALEREVETRIANVLAPIGTAEHIHVSLSGVRLSRVRLHAPSGWPAADVLRADSITIEPDLRDLLQKRVHLRRVVIDGFTASVLRTASGGLKVMPNLQQSIDQASVGESEAPATQDKLVDHIEFTNGTFEFYDETVQHPPYRIAIEDAHATIDHIHLPALTEPTMVAMTGRIKGPQHTGTVSFNGWVKIATKDSQTTTQLRGVDIVTLDPYLLKKVSAKTPVAGGTLDMTVTATVQNQQLHAPGVMTIDHLQLADTGDPLDTFLSLPTKIAVAALKRHGDRITLHFELDGNLSDPKFSLNESLATKLSSGFAEALGVNVKGVAKGVGETLKGLSGALRNLIGQ
jgi:hypothetical protein